jgi:hypothetical protein
MHWSYQDVLDLPMAVYDVLVEDLNRDRKR